jgi:hypothetical protein
MKDLKNVARAESTALWSSICLVDCQCQICLKNELIVLKKENLKLRNLLTERNETFAEGFW